MEDLRQKRHKNIRINNSNVLLYLKKNWLKISSSILFLTIIIFPEFIGNTIGEWLNTLITSFLNNINF